MSFFATVGSPGSISAVTERDWNEPRDMLTGRLLKHLTARELEFVYKRQPELRKLGIEPCDAPKPRAWEISGTFNGQLIVDIDKAFRESALLRDPAPVRHTPTKPLRHDSERAMAAAYHEAGHACMGLLLGLRITSATIKPDRGSDGHTMIQVTDDVGINCAFDLAGQIADEMSGVPMNAANYVTDNARTPAEMRAEMKPLVRKYLNEAWGAVDEIAKQLLVRGTLGEFQVKLAYVRGLQNWRAKHGVPSTDAKAAPKAGVVKRRYDFSIPADVRAFNQQMGYKDLDREPLGTTQGYILSGGGR